MRANHLISFENQNLLRYEYGYFCNSAASLPIIFTNEDGEISGMAIAVPGFICDFRLANLKRFWEQGTGNRGQGRKKCSNLIITATAIFPTV